MEEYMLDPFKCIDAKFFGESGKGEVKIESNDKCEESRWHKL